MVHMHNTASRIPTAVEGLDDMLGGGLAQGASYVIIGGTKNDRDALMGNLYNMTVPIVQVLTKTPFTDFLSAKGATVSAEGVIGSHKPLRIVDLAVSAIDANYRDGEQVAITNCGNYAGVSKRILDGTFAFEGAEKLVLFEDLNRFIDETKGAQEAYRALVYILGKLRSIKVPFVGALDPALASAYDVTARYIDAADYTLNLILNDDYPREIVLREHGELKAKQFYTVENGAFKVVSAPTLSEKQASVGPIASGSLDVLEARYGALAALVKCQRLGIDLKQLVEEILGTKGQ